LREDQEVLTASLRVPELVPFAPVPVEARAKHCGSTRVSDLGYRPELSFG